MIDESPVLESKKMERWEGHRFTLLIVLTLLVSLFLVAVALALYASSGAAQLDLSRPGYKSVRNQAVRSDSFNGFPASGPINDTTLNEFSNEYDKQAEKATNVDAFSGDVMSDEALSIEEASTKK